MILTLNIAVNPRRISRWRVLEIRTVQPLAEGDIPGPRPRSCSNWPNVLVCFIRKRLDLDWNCSRKTPWKFQYFPCTTKFRGKVILGGVEGVAINRMQLRDVLYTYDPDGRVHNGRVHNKLSSSIHGRMLLRTQLCELSAASMDVLEKRDSCTYEIRPPASNRILRSFTKL